MDHHKTILYDWMESVCNQSIFYNPNKEESWAYKKTIEIVVDCAIELVDKMLDILDNRMCISRLQTLGTAALFLSFKLMGGYDAIWFDYWDSDMLDELIRLTDYSSSREVVLQMESDIMRRTDWKGCDAMAIDRFY